MKRAFFILFIITSLFANRAEELKAMLLEAVAGLLNENRERVYVYIQDERLKDLSRYFKKVVAVENCFDADMVFAKDVEKLSKECRAKKIFATRYSSYKKSKDISMGAFFWQKGRPTIIFNKRVLSRFHIVLPDKFKKYEEQ